MAVTISKPVRPTFQLLRDLEYLSALSPVYIAQVCVQQLVLGQFFLSAEPLSNLCEQLLVVADLRLGRLDHLAVLLDLQVVLVVDACLGELLVIGDLSVANVHVVI